MKSKLLNKDMCKINMTGVIVLVVSFFLLFGGIYLLATDVDFFLTQQTCKGTFRMINDGNNAIRVDIKYYNTFKKIQFQRVKQFENSYRYILKKQDSNNVDIIYTKWFDQVFIKNLETPRFLILFFEALLILFSLVGIKAGSKTIIKPKEVTNETFFATVNEQS